MTSPAPQPPTPPEEARLIRLAREARNLSPERAATRLPFRYSGSSWRQIEQGYRGRAHTPVSAKPSVLAHMARVVGVGPERLEGAGRQDAAEVLREVERQESEVIDPLQKLDPGERRAVLSAVEALDGLTAEEVEQVVEQYLRKGRRDTDGPQGHDNSRK